jgi:hypothetical protein
MLQRLPMINHVAFAGTGGLAGRRARMRMPKSAFAFALRAILPCLSRATPHRFAVILRARPSVMAGMA